MQLRRHQSRGCARGAWVGAFGLTADAVHLAIGSSVGADAIGLLRSCIVGHFQQWLSGRSVLRVVGATAVRGGLFVEARQLRHPKTT